MVNKYQFAKELIDLYEKHEIEIEGIDIVTRDGFLHTDKDITGMSE